MPKTKELSINCAARNAVLVYPRAAEPRFPGTRRSGGSSAGGDGRMETRPTTWQS